MFAVWTSNWYEGVMFTIDTETGFPDLVVIDVKERVAEVE